MAKGKKPTPPKGGNKRNCTKFKRRRPRSGWLIFLAEVRARLWKKDPKMPITEVSRRASICWRKMSDCEKAEYSKKACPNCTYCPLCKRPIFPPFGKGGGGGGGGSGGGGKGKGDESSNSKGNKKGGGSCCSGDSLKNDDAKLNLPSTSKAASKEEDMQVDSDTDDDDSDKEEEDEDDPFDED